MLIKINTLLFFTLQKTKVPLPMNLRLLLNLEMVATKLVSDQSPWYHKEYLKGKNERCPHCCLQVSLSLEQNFFECDSFII